MQHVLLTDTFPKLAAIVIFPPRRLQGGSACEERTTTATGRIDAALRRIRMRILDVTYNIYCFTKLSGIHFRVSLLEMELVLRITLVSELIILLNLLWY